MNAILKYIPYHIALSTYCMYIVNISVFNNPQRSTFQIVIILDNK